MNDDDDIPSLSAETMLALQEFLSTKQLQENLVANRSLVEETLKVNDIEENWVNIAIISNKTVFPEYLID